MKAACFLLTIIILVAIMAVCVMVKFATDITVEERKRDYSPTAGVYQVAKSIAVIALSENKSLPIAERFPYVAAIASNSSKSWNFACFASVVLGKWIVTSAHCRKKNATHRVLLLSDFTRNITRTFPILFWRIHEKFNTSAAPLYDIAVAKFNVEEHSLSIKPSILSNKFFINCEASIWKTVLTMDKRVYLINDFDKLDVNVSSPNHCYESYGISMDESLICIDLNNFDDCFMNEFGPLYDGDRLVGVLAVKPRDCDVKFALFTNVSYFTPWILKLTHTTSYG